MRTSWEQPHPKKKKKIELKNVLAIGTYTVMKLINHLATKSFALFRGQLRVQLVGKMLTHHIHDDETGKVISQLYKWISHNK
jgi:hypothetical protein